MSHTQEEMQPAAPGRPRAETRVGPVQVSAVLPVFAEKQTVPELVAGLHQGLGDRLHEVILIVAPKAPPDTLEICHRTAATYPRTRVSMQERNPGLGFGVRQGIGEATGSHVLLMDSDGEMDVATVPPMVEKLIEDDADMVLGSRWMKGGGVEGYDPLKYWLNRGYQTLFRLLFRTRVHDLTLGFKLCRRDVFQAMPWDSQFHDIGCETTLRIIRAGYRVTEVPTVWRRRKEGESSNPFRRNFKYVWKALAILVGPSHRAQTPSQ